ncbi:RagB/SusD family nutrient uptake outer membrane protein [Chishuiella sp.]|uniref:RagB/SusD family nutrient uptake outer membrane protein n=1 Tax=Chishuiella sp. TaxID=1969467 RepID=UPI0028A92628|nr:RagB/SusD family nutrient uptake outer membrane protein [Chishuiella sp.]
MKKIKILILSAFLLTTYSCSEDDLNQFPDYGQGIQDGINPIKDAVTMQKVLIGMYQQMSTENSFASTVINVGNVASDEFFVSSNNSGYFLTSSNLSWTPSSSDFTAEYDELYDVVSQANLVLNSSIEETSVVKGYKGQAYTARGMAFLYLAMGWAENPTSGKNQEYGIALPTGEFNAYAKFPRSTVEATYAQIISDLEKGIELSDENPTSKAYLSATAARLLLAKAYLWKGDYTNAIKYANETLNNKPSSFSLLQKSEIEEYFYGETEASFENQPETVWEVGLTNLNNPGPNYTMGVLYDYLDPMNTTTTETGLNTRRSILARANVVSGYSDNDERKKLFVADTRSYDSPAGYFINKYRKTIKEGNSYVQYIGNVKVLRLSEALFIKWEAMAKSGQGSTALSELNDFATERGGTTYSGDALTSVLAEKQKEFAGEGHRFYDLKRNNLSINRLTNCNSNCSVSSGDKLFVFPIPSYSLNNNTTITQYPGWGN